MQNQPHICCKCGWGYPNHHPSAKQRRAHKKVCGNKIHESGDDQELHDKGLRRDLVERQVSCQSEGEEFSDAVNEFVEADLKGSSGGNTQPSDSPIYDITPGASTSAAFKLDNFTKTQYHSSNNAAVQLDNDAKAHYQSSDSPIYDRTPGAPTNATFQLDYDTQSQYHSSSSMIDSAVGFIRNIVEPVMLHLPKKGNGNSSTSTLISDAASIPNKRTQSLVSNVSEANGSSNEEPQTAHTEDVETRENVGYLPFIETCQNTISGDAHPGCLSSKLDESPNVPPLATMNLEDSCEQAAVCSSRMVEEVYTGQEVDISIMKSVNEGLELHEPEALLDSTTCDEANRHSEAIQMGPHYSEQDISVDSLPQTVALVAASDDISRHEKDAMKSDFVIGKDASLHEEAIKDTPEKARNYNVEAIDEITMQRKIESENSFPKYQNFQETASSPSELVTKLSAMIINTSQLQNTNESVSESQDCSGEKYMKGLNKVTIRSVETSVNGTNQVEFAGADGRINKFLQDERQSDSSREEEMIENGAEGTITQESTLSVENTLLNSSSLEDGAEIFELREASDSCLQCLENHENSPMEKQLEAMSVVLLDAPVDSFSLTGSIEEGYGGSLSDVTVPSSTNSSSIPAAEILPKTDAQAPKEGQVAESEKASSYEDHQYLSDADISEAPCVTLAESTTGNSQKCASEIQAIQNQQLSHVPSLKDALSELQGRKKNEVIKENDANRSSGKIRAPLKSFLVEPPTYEDGTTSTAQAMTGPEIHSNKSPNTNRETEWNSPARLPKSRQKTRVWTPFSCCLSVTKPSGEPSVFGTD